MEKHAIEKGQIWMLTSDEIVLVTGIDMYGLYSVRLSGSRYEVDGVGVDWFNYKIGG